MKAVLGQVIVLTAILAAGSVWAQAPELARMDVVERRIPAGPVAFVDGATITSEEFRLLYYNKLTLIAMQAGTSALDDETRVEMAIGCLRDLIQREILHQEATRRGLSVSNSEEDEAYRKRIEGLQEQFTTSEGKTPTESEILSKSGQTAENAREDMRKTLLVNKVWDQIAEENNVSVTDEEAKDFYKLRPDYFQRPARLHLQQVFVRPEPNAQDADEAGWEEADKRIRNALMRVMAGEKLDVVAKEVSESMDREEGGDIGMAPIEQLPPFYVEAARDMAQGDLSNVLRSEHGLHFFKLIAREDAAPVPLDVALPRIKAALAETKTEALVHELCLPVIDDPDRVRIYLMLDRSDTQDAVEGPEPKDK